MVVEKGGDGGGGKEGGEEGGRRGGGDRTRDLAIVVKARKEVMRFCFYPSPREVVNV